ncbi:hypothetical protein OIU84_020576 [Salix udensis]|uniref:Uncharacterized protein n=1 Tax=Salix udensis TaxID=889485 RepID=A0AAD6KSV2_9ROSI|nr:hypothetical protein OIU84_020576 [Salix udensis]
MNRGSCPSFFSVFLLLSGTCINKLLANFGSNSPTVDGLPVSGLCSNHAWPTLDQDLYGSSFGITTLVMTSKTFKIPDHVTQKGQNGIIYPRTNPHPKPRDSQHQSNVTLHSQLALSRSRFAAWIPRVHGKMICCAMSISAWTYIPALVLNVQAKMGPATNMASYSHARATHVPSPAAYLAGHSHVTSGSNELLIDDNSPVKG